MQNRNNHNVFSPTAVRFGVYEFKCFKFSRVEQFFCVIFKRKIQTFVSDIILKKIKKKNTDIFVFGNIKECGNNTHHKQYVNCL